MTDPIQTYKNLLGYTASTGKAYLDPCSTDPTASAITCNLTMGCGTPMPSGPGKVTADQATKIQTWVACGSPNN